MTSATSAPLNAALFTALQGRFGTVRTVNRGQERRVRYEPDPRRPGLLRAVAEQRGEQYCICCPFCQDEKFHLYASYEYGHPDPCTGRSNLALWCCFRRQCHKSPANRDAFRMMTRLPPGREALPRGPSPSVATPAPTSPAEIRLPAGLLPLNTLGPSHPAVAYLLQRGFDVEEVSLLWNVTFCAWSTDAHPSPVNRLVIPIFRPARLFAPPSAEAPPLILGGWQARVIPGLELGGDEKYLSAQGTKKSELLYGLPHALQTSGPVAVMEGPSDVWRFGPGAVALLGKSLSMTQKLLLVHHFPGRPIAVMLDVDAAEEAQQVQQDLQLARYGAAGDNRVVVAALPMGREDPGECGREELWESMARALEQRV